MTGVDRTEVARSSGKAVWSPEASSLKVSVDVSVEVTVVAAASPGRGAQGHRQDKTRRRQGDGSAGKGDLNMGKSRLHEVDALGQAVWIDYLSRDLLETGELARKMRDAAITGVTSNPTIFQKAKCCVAARSQNPKLLRPGWSSGRRPKGQRNFRSSSRMGRSLMDA